MATAPTSAPLLTERARAGDHHAFTTLVETHADRVYGALRSFALDPEEAEEVAQDVFVRAWRGLHRFEGRAQLSTWLYRIAFNEAQRCVSNRRTPPVRPGPEGHDAIYALPDAPRFGPEASALDHELDETMRRALARLPEEWRSAVILRDLEGLSTEEAAEAMGIAPAALKSRLHRGRTRLRSLLEPYLELEAAACSHR